MSAARASAAIAGWQQTKISRDRSSGISRASSATWSSGVTAGGGGSGGRRRRTAARRVASIARRWATR
ncbi:hypothetical protein U1839_01570 [Sphingomonas sp. RT2P30]|uniref:hypothetical protein n=1 Tax=Parasphingomonas halimpatiens TaxID=3096162 RepID=UPI002FC8C929